MRKETTKFKTVLEGVDLDARYPFEEALAFARKASYEKFDASLEVHIRTGIDVRKGDQQIRSSVILPHGTGKKVRVAVFAEGDGAMQAKEAGADIIGDKELIDEIKKTGKLDADVAVATPDMMKHLAAIARVLGPRGLMPSPKNDTVTMNIRGAVEQAKKGKVDFRNDSSGNIHQAVGKMSFDDAKLIDNYKTFIDAVKKARPAAAKGTFIKNLSISTTMGPAIRVVIE